MLHLIYLKLPYQNQRAYNVSMNSFRRQFNTISALQTLEEAFLIYKRS